MVKTVAVMRRASDELMDQWIHARWVDSEYFIGVEKKDRSMLLALIERSSFFDHRITRERYFRLALRNVPCDDVAPFARGELYGLEMQGVR